MVLAIEKREIIFKLLLRVRPGRPRLWHAPLGLGMRQPRTMLALCRHVCLNPLVPSA